MDEKDDIAEGKVEEYGVSGMSQRKIDLLAAEMENAYRGDRDERGRRHGKGQYTAPSTGNMFVGNYECDKKNGIGTMKLASGDMYEGHWLKNKKRS